MCLTPPPLGWTVVLCPTPPPLGWTVVLCPMFNQQSGRQVSYEWFHVRVKCCWETLTWVSDLKLSITSCRCCSSFTLSLRRASSCSVRSLSSFLLFSGISCRSASYGPTNIHHTLTVILWLLLQQNTAFPLQSLLFFSQLINFITFSLTIYSALPQLLSNTITNMCTVASAEGHAMLRSANRGELAGPCTKGKCYNPCSFRDTTPNVWSNLLKQLHRSTYDISRGQFV